MVRVLRSSLLSAAGICHGFSTRHGGVSKGPFASLNLGVSWGDDPAAVAENLRRLSQAAGFDAARLCQVVQVHGSRVVLLAAPQYRQQEADGMATAERLTLGVLSADCVAILLGDGQGRVAAVHAGWRGTVAGIAIKAVEALQALGARPEAIRAALGPSIGPCCFEVAEEVAAMFRRLVPDAVLPGRRAGKYQVDLRCANKALLLRAGLVPEHIDDHPPCTLCDPSSYFSYRRDGAPTGQHLAFITGGSA
ncbi:MAG: peptidoglycan editing factor PgeF [Myxococcales bacterium]|nr:peptidoglycan editing factor PgeF [Myxococcota bacterium]MDW8280720.1 peptidoglycan editing factor PgeF [Myxococcales bacterium]